MTTRTKSIRNGLTLVVLSSLIHACSGGGGGGGGIRKSVPPVAKMSASPVSGLTPFTVAFQNLSTTPGQSTPSYRWDFGDGTTSSESSPSHTYSKVGDYTVALTVTSSSGTDRVVVRDMIRAASLSPGFHASPGSGDAPLRVQFTNTTEIVNAKVEHWHWNFGDGTVSSNEHPEHTYNEGGEFTVSLTATSDAGGAIFDGTVNVSIFRSDFEGWPLTGNAPLTVAFDNKIDSVGYVLDSVHWELGDGNVADMLNPIHTYALPGKYSVSLAAFTDGRSDSVEKLEYIHVRGPVSDFSASPRMGDAPLSVAFTNESLVEAGASLSYVWDFGDGNTSTDENPIHDYAAPGAYSVGLQVNSSLGGSDRKIRDHWVLVSNAGFGPDDYIVMFQENNVAGTQIPPDRRRLYISSETSTTGVVRLPGLLEEGIPFERIFTTTPGETEIVHFPREAAITNTEFILPLGIHIESVSPTRVHGLTSAIASTDGFLGYPLRNAGTHYMALAMPAHSGSSPAQLAVCAMENDTTVTITPTFSTIIREKGVPFDVTLDALEIFQLQTFIAKAELSGTTIQSDKPVVAFSGNVLADVRHTEAADHLVEQLLPTDFWGNQFIAVTSAGRSRGDALKFLAATDGTRILIKGAINRTVDLNATQSRLIGMDDFNVILSNHPIFVVQLANSQEFDWEDDRPETTQGDPFMMTLTPTPNFPSTITFPPRDLIYRHYLTIIAPAADALQGLVLVDGVPVPTKHFRQVEGTEFAFARVRAPGGAFEVFGPNPLQSYSYGFADYESYAYTGGFSN